MRATISRKALDAITCSELDLRLQGVRDNPAVGRHGNGHNRYGTNFRE